MPSSSHAHLLRIGFAGTPDFAATILRGLLDAGLAPLVVYTQPDRRGRRGRRLQPPPVKTLALGRNLPVRQPPTLREEAPALAALELDALVVAAYGLILPPAVLTAPKHGCINVHASLLPRWRGAAPVERAIMAGDQETGVSIMQMDEGIDTGPVYLSRRCPITGETDGPALEARLARLGYETLLECLHRLDTLDPVAQPETGVSYAAKLTRADAVIRWGASAPAIERQVRALKGRLPAFTHAGGNRITVLAAKAIPDTPGMAAGTIVGADAGGIVIACGDGALVALSLKLDIGKGRPLTAADAVNGYPSLFAPGARLGGTTDTRALPR